jgi:energy-coupling factor transport system permease protein
MKTVQFAVTFVIIRLLSAAFIVVTGVRFLPIIITEVATVLSVRRLKGFKPTRFGRGMIKTALGVLTPTLAGCVRRAGVLILTAVLTAAATVILKILFNLYISEIYYSSALRDIYAFTRGYL